MNMSNIQTIDKLIKKHPHLMDLIVDLNLKFDEDTPEENEEFIEPEKKK